MFPLNFPLGVLSRARPDDWVLDPFCGRGTTNYAARLLGLASVGVDANPVAAAIADAKTVTTTPARILFSAQKILSERSGVTRVPKGEFWERCFDARTLHDLSTIRASLLQDCSSSTRKALRAFLLGRLHGPRTKISLPSYLSNQMPRTFAPKPNYAVGFWRAKRLKPPHVNLLDLIERLAERYFSNIPASVESAIVCGDSRTIPLTGILKSLSSSSRAPQFNWVVTSPPYFGMRTYVPDQWLRNWFVGGPSDVDYASATQIGINGYDGFITNLAAVWRNVATACVRGATMVVRFGRLPSEGGDPREMLYESFREAECGWIVKTARTSGKAAPGRRQASQFVTVPAKQIQEYDVFLRLE